MVEDFTFIEEQIRQTVVYSKPNLDESKTKLKSAFTEKLVDLTLFHFKTNFNLCSLFNVELKLITKCCTVEISGGESFTRWLVVARGAGGQEDRRSQRARGREDGGTRAGACDVARVEGWKSRMVGGNCASVIKKRSVEVFPPPATH